MDTILIVEDEISVRENLIELFEAENFMALSAGDGSEGYRIASENHVDLILSDIKMPVTDGLQFLQMLQRDKKTARIPFVFLTAKIEMSDLREGMNLGADDYIIKPYESKELLKIVKRKVLESKNGNVKGIKEHLIKSFPHELRPALNGIISFSEIIDDESGAFSRDEIRRMATAIKKTGKQIHKKIEKYVQYSELVSLSKSDVVKIIERTGNFSLDPHSMKTGLINFAKEYNRENDINISFDDGILHIPEKFYKIILNKLLEFKIMSSLKGSALFVNGFIDSSYYRTKVFDKAYLTKKSRTINYNHLHRFYESYYQIENIGATLELLKESLRLFDGYMKINCRDNDHVQIEFGIPIGKQ